MEAKKLSSYSSNPVITLFQRSEAFYAKLLLEGYRLHTKKKSMFTTNTATSSYFPLTGCLYSFRPWLAALSHSTGFQKDYSPATSVSLLPEITLTKHNG